MKLFLTFIGLVLSVPLFSQEPGTTIQLYLTRNDRPIYWANELQSYHLTVNGSSNYLEVVKENKQRSYRKYFSWSPYREETYMIRILHGKDTMDIDIKMDLKNNPMATREGTLEGERYYLWNVCFTIEVPFAKGYYVVDRFVPGSWKIEYIAAPGFKWINKK